MSDSPDSTIVERMAEVASNFLASLSTEGRAKAQLAFADEEERTRWFYTPNPRAGLPLREMEAVQQRRAHQLLASGLSHPGYVTVSTIMGLENILDAEEGFRVDWYPGRGRDPGMYFVSVFGEPGESTWGWRFEGHHVSVHYTIVDGVIATPTPLFFGADPAEASLMGANLLRPLASVTDLARDCVHALDAEQRSAAVIAAAAPLDIMLTNHSTIEDGLEPRPAMEMMGRQPTAEWSRGTAQQLAALGYTSEQHEVLRYRDEPRGLAGARMSVDQRAILEALIGQYIDRLPEELAAIEQATLTTEMLDRVHFAWAGGIERGEPHYYRLQAPRFVVEYDCTQRGANHVHSVWRDPQADFGRELLSRHYAVAH
jgi:hypothetical protein